jgi:hypothetical protein
MFESALGAAISLIVLMCYFDLKRVAGCALLIEVITHLVLFYVFTGTYSGGMTGLLAGLFITAFLRGYRYLVGYEKPAFTTKGLVWTPVPAGRYGSSA